MKRVERNNVVKKNSFTFSVLSFELANLIILMGALFLFSYIAQNIRFSFLTVGIVMIIIGLILRLVDYNYNILKL